jgi:hypothetical protein
MAFNEVRDRVPKLSIGAVAPATVEPNLKETLDASVQRLRGAQGRVRTEIGISDWVEFT